jgi:hypothetical protein
MSKNAQTVNVCTNAGDPATCADQTAGSNFVYLRTDPKKDAPLINDPIMRPDGTANTTKIEDWGAKATYGQKYGLADQKGDWTAIWFGGQKAWFYNPASQPTAVLTHATTIKLKPGATAAGTIFGGAYPEASVYPADVKGPIQPKLSYTFQAGQTYVADDAKAPTDYFYDATIDYSKPHDHEIFTGKDKYYKIQYNQRVMFVKASDVVKS